MRGAGEGFNFKIPFGTTSASAMSCEAGKSKKEKNYP